LITKSELFVRTSLTLKQMAALVAIAEHGSFSAAADHLHVSQPALSRTVRLAEECVGTRIFDRDTRSVSLTPEGEELLPIAQRILREFHDSMGALSQFIEGTRGRVRATAVPSLARSLLVTVAKRYCSDFPGVGLVLGVHAADRILELLERREIDVGLSVEAPLDGRFDFRYLRDEEVVLVCPKNDPLAGSGLQDSPLEWSVFTSRPFIAAMVGTHTRASTDAAFKENRLAVVPAHEVASIDLPLIGGLISAGLGLSAVPESALEVLGQSDLAARRLHRPAVRRRVGVVKLAGRSTSAAVQRFLDYVMREAVRD
jgi:LysR family transcriptional regulator, carnitine catabolism transcriptional activator